MLERFGLVKYHMTPKEFTDRLEAISRDNGVLYGRLRALEAAKLQHVMDSSRYKGFDALVNAWKCFFLETVEQFNSFIRPQVKDQLPFSYALLLERLALYFSGLNAAEIVATQGYPLQAYTLLRNVFDSVVLCSAVAQGLTDFPKLEGVEDGKEFDPAIFQKLRRKEERKIRPMMTGEASGLSAETASQLAKWDVLFDHETHGGLLSRAFSADWLRGTQPLPVMPQFLEDRYAMYLNRYCEIAWMVHRLLPLIQPRGIPLGADWKSKWRTLDESFLETAKALTVQMGKPIGAAIVELVEMKFPFNADATFWA